MCIEDGGSMHIARWEDKDDGAGACVHVSVGARRQGEHRQSLLTKHRLVDESVRFTGDRGTNLALDARIDKHDARERGGTGGTTRYTMTKRDAGTNMCTGLRGFLAL